MSAPFFQAAALHQAHCLTHRLLANGRTFEEKVVACAVAELFFAKAYLYLSTSSLIEPATNRLIFGSLALLPLAKIGAHLIWNERREEETSLSHLIRIASYLLFIGLKVHALASFILNREWRPLLIFAPFFVEKGYDKLPTLSIQTERKVIWLKEAVLNLCLFYPVSALYYVREIFNIVFFDKPIGDYTSYLTENYLEGIKACKGEEIDYLTPAYFAVLYEIEKGKRHPDEALYPERKAKLDALRGQDLSGVKEELLRGERGSVLAQQVRALTGYYTGTAGDLLDKDKGFLPHISILNDKRL